MPEEKVYKLDKDFDEFNKKLNMHKLKCHVTSTLIDGQMTFLGPMTLIEASNYINDMCEEIDEFEKTIAKDFLEYIICEEDEAEEIYEMLSNDEWNYKTNASKLTITFTKEDFREKSLTDLFSNLK